MSKNTAQVYATNPVTTIGNTDLLYLAESGTTDAAIQGSDLIAQFSGGGSVTPQDIQNNAFSFVGTDTGTADNYAIAPSPAISAYQDGQSFSFLPANNNTSSACFINISGLGDIPIIAFNNISLMANDILTNTPCYIIIGNGGTIAYVQNPATTGTLGVLPPQIQQQQFTYAVDFGGTPNDYQIAVTPAIVSYIEPFTATFRTAFANSGPSTMDVNGVGPVPIVLNDGSALVGGEILANSFYTLISSGTYSSFVLMNPSGSGGVTATQVQQNAFNKGIDSGNVNAFVVSDISPAIGTLTDGLIVSFYPLNITTGPSTLDVGSGPLPILRAGATGLGLIDTASGDILNGVNANVMYIGSSNSWFLLNPLTVNALLTTISYQSPSTGDNVLFLNDINTLILDPASTLAALTITFPVSPIQNQEVRISCSQIVTTLTFAPSGGDTVSNAPVAFAAGQGYGFIYNLTNTNWYRTY